MQSNFGLHPRIAAWLVAALLLLAQWGALAHQIEHQAQSPHAPCLVCVCADQFGNAVPTVIAAAPAVRPDILFPASTFHSPAHGSVLAFRSRAPPILSLTI